MLNDEIIGAYLDGELTPARRAEVEAALQQNKGAIARLERMRAADAVLREAMGASGETRAKDPLAALILSDWPAEVRPLRVRTEWVRQAAALAAACVLGVFAGNLSAPQGLVHTDMSVSSAVAALLDHAPSGAARTANGSTVQVALSFRTDAGDFCRQFRATSGAAVSDAVACRGKEGWRTLVQAAVSNGEGYRTASASDPIAASIDGMGGVSVLSADEEQALISAGWRQ